MNPKSVSVDFADALFLLYPNLVLLIFTGVYDSITYNG
jgi:hypothetical protein